MGNPENKIITTDWKIHEKPEQTVEIVSSLIEALKCKDIDTVQEMLRDPENLRSLVERRGDASSNHRLFENGFDLLLKDRFGSEGFYQAKGSEIIDFIHEYKIPEEALTEYLDIAYHKRDKVLFNHLLTIIFDNEEKLSDKSIIGRALHNLATWKAAAEKNIDEALNYQGRALMAARAAGDKKLEEKIKYGFTFAKNLKPKDKIAGYEKVISGMEALDHKYDAMKARVDESLARVDLAQRQKGTKQFDLRTENLDAAKKLALVAYDFSLAQGISNLEVMSLEALSKIHKEMGEIRSARQYEEKATLAHEKYKNLTNRL